MIWLAALAALDASPQPQAEERSSASSAVAQATASIRIISGVRLKLDAEVNAFAPRARDAFVTTSDGVVLKARLIEFE